MNSGRVSKKRLNQAYPWTEPYKVENEPGTDHTLIDATPEAMERIRQYLMIQ